MEPKKPKLNVRLLNKVLRHIKAEPKRFNMATFGQVVDPNEPWAPACGTQACIGGWAYLLTLSPKSWKRMLNKAEQGDFDIQERATKVLGLTVEEGKCLFLTNTGDHRYSTAKAKIDLLKEDREQFVKKYIGST